MPLSTLNETPNTIARPDTVRICRDDMCAASVQTSKMPSEQLIHTVKHE